MDASQSSLGSEIFRQIDEAKSIDHIILGKKPCFKITKHGLGPLVQFEDNSVKFDLSSNILNNPLGYNFPLFNKISQLNESDLISSEKIKIELSKILDLNYLDIFFSSKNNNSINYKLFQNGNLLDMNFNKGLSLPLFNIYLCIGKENDDESISNKDINLFYNFFKFLSTSNFLNDNDLIYSKSSKIIFENTKNFIKINDFIYQLPNSILNNLDSLNESGIYLNDKSIYFPFSLHPKELLTIFEIINN